MAGSFTGNVGRSGISRRRTPIGARPRTRCDSDSTKSVIIRFSIGMASRRLPDAPTPARRRQRSRVPPMLPDDSRSVGARPPAALLARPPLHHRGLAQAPRRARAARRRRAHVPQRLSSAATIGLAFSVVFFLTRLFVPRAAAPALARPPQADPVLHLHRRRPVAADPRVLPVRQRLLSMNVGAYLFKDGYDDVTRHVQLIAEAAAAEIARPPGRRPRRSSACTGTVRRRFAIRRSRWSLSLRRRRRAGQRVAAGPWEHLRGLQTRDARPGLGPRRRRRIHRHDRSDAARCSERARSSSSAPCGWPGAAIRRSAGSSSIVPLDDAMLNRLHERTGVKAGAVTV